MSDRILVAGGGIGGLTVAIALKQLGANVEVLERAPAFAPLGAGITVQANAHAILHALGIQIPDRHAVQAGPFKVLNPSGQVLMSGDPSNVKTVAPSINMQRSDLHQALWRRIEELDIRCQLAAYVESLDERDREVVVNIHPGRQEACRLLIGADGARSQVRRALLGPQQSQLRMCRQTCWRLAMQVDEDRYPAETIEHWDRGRRVGIVPLPNNMIYMYLVLSHWWRDAHTRQGKPRGFPDAFMGIAKTVDFALSRLGNVPVHMDELGDQPRVHYGSERVLLMGDAAHAITPNLGQGAGMAIEDAAAIALQYADGFASLPERLAATREQRVRVVQRLSWRIGQAAHVRNPVLRAMRDLLLRTMPSTSTERRAAILWTPGERLAERLAATVAHVQSSPN